MISRVITILAIALTASVLSAAQRPNVVVLLADDLGWKDLGCYGGPVKTPTLDSLAAQGVRFTDFHAGAAVCSPSRATLLTGRQHMRTGIYQVLQDTMHNAHLLEREVTIAEVLKQSGYATAHFGKWHLGLTWSNRKKPSPSEHGFDYWFGLANGASPSQKDPVNFIRNGKRVGPLKGYSCQIVVDDAIRWLSEERAKEEPFFLNVWFTEPHSVLAAPDEIVSQYGGLKDPAALYSGAIDNTDRAIARLVAKLKDTGELENTLIIYSSDNGSYRDDRNGGLRGAKGSNFEGGIRSPGIFFWPHGIKGGRIEKEPAGSVDLLPTICGLLSIDKPNGVHLDGADLAPLLTGRGRFQRQQPLFWYNPASDLVAAIRDGRYALMAYRNYKLPQDQRAISAVFNQIAKLVRREDGKPSDAELRTRIFNQEFDEPEARRLSNQYVMLNTFQESWIPLIKAGGFGRFELYDVDADPKQTKDISAQQPEVAARLQKKLLEINASVMADAPEWVSANEAKAHNWHQWRGPEANGVSRKAKPPLEWSETKNIQWKAGIEGHGSSTPIIWGDKVFLLTAINTGKADPSLPRPEDQPKRMFGITNPNTTFEFVVLCLDRNSGKQLWRQTATRKIPHEGTHGDNNFASASPVTDGERLYCWFGSAGLFCYDLNGKKQWERNLGQVQMGALLGEGGSPALHDGKLVIVRDNQKQSTIEVFDARTGATLWKQNRDEVNTWATPLIVEHSGKTQVITSGSKRVRSYDLDTGEIIWQCGGLTGNPIPCPVVENGLVYCMTGYQGYSLLALPLNAKGDITGTSAIVWSTKRGTPYVPSPLLYDGLLFFSQSNQNPWSCLDAKTGEVGTDRERLPGMSGIYASPVGADGRVYVSGRDGTTLVLERSKTLKMLATNQLDDTFHASPALVGDQLFLRGRKAVYCISGKPGVANTAANQPQRGIKPLSSPNAKLLAEIETHELPKGYTGAAHQAYVDRRMAGLSPDQRARIGQLWKEKQRIDPAMRNRGASFVKILEYVAANVK